MSGSDIFTSVSYLQYHSSIPSGTFDLVLGGMTVSGVSVGASEIDIYNAFKATSGLYNVRKSF